MSTKEYAGFWLRFVAYLIDGIIVGAVQTIIIAPVMAMFGLGIASMENMDSMSDEESMAFIMGAMGTMGTTFLIVGLIGIIYFTLMEASKYQATLGKMALGLKVTDTEGNPLDFGKALLRNLGKIISNMIMMIGYIMAGFTDKKQALHDMIAGALVVKK